VPVPLEGPDGHRVADGSGLHGGGPRERLLVWRGEKRSPMTQETVSPRGGSQAVRAARRDEAALLGEVLADGAKLARSRDTPRTPGTRPARRPLPSDRRSQTGQRPDHTPVTAVKDL
jgi:hypothetical protein